jgi:hypothetical protein
MAAGRAAAAGRETSVGTAGAVGEPSGIVGTDGAASLAAVAELAIGRLAAAAESPTVAGAGREVFRAATPRDPRRGALDDAVVGAESAEACCEVRSGVPESGLSARATPVPVASAAPTPRATASAPIRPT